MFLNLTCLACIVQQDGLQEGMPDMEEQRFALQRLDLLQHIHGRLRAGRCIQRAQQRRQHAHVQPPPLRQLFSRHRLDLRAQRARQVSAGSVRAWNSTPA